VTTVAGGIGELARELFDSRAQRTGVLTPPSAREGTLDLQAAYLVEAELVRMRRVEGHATVGRKVGFANKAMWRVMKLQTLVWAHMYDDTVVYACGGNAGLQTRRMWSPRIEPEVVFKLRQAPASTDPAAVLESVEWVALGFEFVDCPFPDWKFQPVDFVATFGFHAALVVGDPRPVDREKIPSLVEQLGAMKVRLSKNGELIEEGFGKNALRNPAACLGELSSAIAAQPGADPLAPGELVSTGTLTGAQPVTPGERWDVVADGIELAPLAVTLNS
jgi:2-oxo-3-hexenedioate decarboxylase